MKVICHYKSDDQPLVCAYPAKTGVLFRLCSGDICDPHDGNWFTPPYPTSITRKIAKVWRPYFAWRLGSWWGGYIGFQVYGVDSPQYLNFLPAKDVYDGSQALSLTIRLTTNVD